MHQPFDEVSRTIEYYNKNSLSYYEQTVNIDMSDIYEPFLELIPKGGHILDAGCGSGRDTKEFLCRGYEVTAIDASEAMVKLSSQLTGQNTLQMSFQDLAFDTQFDGIWACASLLHVPRSQLKSTYKRFARVSRQNSVWYMSFKLGCKDRFEDNRLFIDYDSEAIRKLIDHNSSLNIIKSWQTFNQGTENSLMKAWLNVLVEFNLVR